MERRNFTTFDEIAEAFGFGVITPDELVDRLHRKRSELHPDRTGGDFSTKQQEDEFHLIDQALSVAKSLNTARTALVPVGAITEIVRAIREAGVPATPESREQLLDNRLTAHVERNLHTFQSSALPPAVVLGAISAVLSALWLFPGLAVDHPVLKHYIAPDRPLFGMVWLYLLGATAVMWLLSWRQKDRYERLQRALRTEEYQNGIFRQFLSSYREEFTKGELINYIEKLHGDVNRKNWLRLLGDTSIDPETGQTVAELVLLRLEQRGVISQVHGKTLSPRYRIVDPTGILYGQ